MDSFSKETVKDGCLGSFFEDDFFVSLWMKDDELDPDGPAGVERSP